MNEVLQFSGGKDSLAMLYLMEERWDNILVMWCNAGAPHPSTIMLMEKIRREVPHFLEVRGRQPEYVQANGYPSDIVPWSATPLGRLVHGSAGDTFCSALDCCHANIWSPLAMACRALDARVIYRGQKRSDKLKAPIEDGHVENGVTYRFPLQDWSDKDVFEYLGDRMPPHYLAGEQTSRDCWDCTAYLGENVTRIRALPNEQRIYVRRKLASLLAHVDTERVLLQQCLGGES